MTGSSLLRTIAMLIAASAIASCGNGPSPAIPQPVPVADSWAAHAKTLPVRGVWASFERPGWSTGYGDGLVVWGFNEFDAIDGRTIRDEVAAQLDLMRSIGINTITFALTSTDEPIAGSVPPSWFQPPKCYAYPSGGLLYPKPTKTSLANLGAFLDLAQSKGMKVILGLGYLHMEQKPSQNAKWLGSIVRAVKNKPALLAIAIMGDVHVNTFSGRSSCGLPAEPALWLGPTSTPGKYVSWAIGYAHSLGLPYEKITAEAIVGANNTRLQPVAVLKQILDGLRVPANRRVYALSWYEHRKCRFAQAPCKDQNPSQWAATSMAFVRKTVGNGSGIHLVATEFGDNDEPVDAHWSTAEAFTDLVTLWQRSGVDGGAFWTWTYQGNSTGYDTSLSLPVLIRGSSLQFSAMAPVIKRYYGSLPTPVPSPAPSPTATPNGPCATWPNGTGILADGDFGQASSTGSFTSGQPLAPAWKVASGNVALSPAGEIPYGVCAVDLDGPGVAGSIQSDPFATVPGATYRVTFMLSGEPGEPRFKRLKVSAAGASQTFQWDAGDYNDLGSGFWGEQTWTFTAQANTTSLSFQSLDTPASTANGPAVAGIQVTQ